MFRVAVTLLLGVAVAGTEAARLPYFQGFSVFGSPGAEVWAKEYEIPQRCIEHSVTAVSCAQVDEEDGLMAHPDDCGLFYYCVNALHDPVCRACPPGLHFSPTEHVCDLPAHAGCHISSTLPPTTSTSSATDPTYSYPPTSPATDTTY